MDYPTYRQRYFVEPTPRPRFNYSGMLGITLFFQDYAPAVAYYESVLGPPAYVERDDTHGWQVGETWLTLLRGRQGNPTNVEVAFVMQTPHDAEQLQQAFIAAGGSGPPPKDELMYIPIHSCPVQDPFGTMLLIYSPL